MKISKLIESYKKKHADTQGIIDVLQNIQVDIPGMFTMQGYSKGNGRDAVLMQAAAKVIMINRDSFRLTFLAIEKGDLYPFSDYRIREDTHRRSTKPFTMAAGLRYIKGWRPLTRKDLPLLITYERTYPLLEQYLKDPKELSE